MKVELKNVKVCEWASKETTCFTASIYIDGKRVGTVENNGRGGCNYYDFKDRKIEQEFYEYCRSLPAVEFMNEPLPMNDEIFIGELLQKYSENQQYKNWCKKEYVFRLKCDKEGEFRTVKKVQGFTLERFKEWLQNKYGNKVDYILNEKIA